MSELQLHRAAIAPQLMLAELGRVFFELILCIVIIVLAFAKCFPKPNEPNDPDDDWHREIRQIKRHRQRRETNPGIRPRPAAASRLTAGLPAGPGFSRFPLAKL